MAARGLTAGMVALVAVATVACGGGGDDAGPTRAEFASQVNGLCADREAKIADLDGGLEDEAGVRRVISINEDLLGQVEDVDAPKDDQAEVDRLVSLIEDQNTTLRTYADALAAGDAPDESAVVDELDSQAAEFDAGAAALGLNSCTAGADGTDSATSDDTEDESAAGPALEDVAQAFIDYMDAYWSGDSAAEQERSTAWAAALAGFHATADLSPAGAAAPQQANVDLSLTSIEPVASITDGYVVEGDITVTTSDATYSYTDLLVVDDPDEGLLVADYCRASSDGNGPLQGCLSDAVGSVNGDLTGSDGSYHIAMGPMVRSLGFGVQEVDFSLCIDALTTSVTVQGGLNTTFVVGTDISGPPQNGIVILPAALGQRSCGYIQINPPAAATDSSFPAGELSIRLEKGDGSSVDVTVKTPALPQSDTAL